MSTLFWPGDERPGDVFSDAGLLEAMAVVETAWSAALTDVGIAPADARRDLTELVSDDDVETLAADAVSGGNPVIPFVSMLRDRLGDTDAARWLHRGLTSQDVVDTALMLMARDTCAVLTLDLREMVEELAVLADRHRATPMIGRTLTQHAVPVVFGAKVAGWLHGVLDAAEDLDAVRFPAQFGGAAGTLSGATVLTGGDGGAAVALTRAAATVLGLADDAPWHTRRTPVTRIGEGLTRVTTACGRIANDVLTLSRPELGELAESDGGGSSTMPQKHNPVRATLVRRAALSAPAHLSLLHLAAADAGDERPAGAWHVEWQPLQLLARHALTAAAQTVALINGLRVDVERMAANLAGAVDVDTERRGLEELAGALPPGTWAGADGALIDAALDRARERLGAGR